MKINRIKKLLITKDKNKTKGDDKHMIKQIAWNTFKKTGNINTFLELKQVTEIEQNIKAEKNEIIESKRNNNSGKDGIRF